MSTAPNPPIYQALVDLMNNLTDAFRPLGDAAQRATEAMAGLSQSVADRQLADILGVSQLPLNGVPVVLASAMEDGKLIYFDGSNPFLSPGASLFLGTHRAPARPYGAPGKDDITDEARLIVRRGMADVCEFIGEDPEWLGRSADILALMRSGTRARIPEDTPDRAT